MKKYIITWSGAGRQETTSKQEAFQVASCQLSKGETVVITPPKPVKK